jgi:predicted DNA binding CopG/RHH family protein
MAKKRIPITVSEHDLEVIKKLMKQEGRSRAYIATTIFQDGLKLVK